MLRTLMIALPAMVVSVSAQAGTMGDTVVMPRLSEPGILGLVAAGVIGAVFVARLRK